MLPKKHLYLIAGEPSGDALGAGLLKSLKAQGEFIFSGVGGPLMEAEGVKSLFEYHRLAIIGFAEILPRVLDIFARVDQTVEDILNKNPDAVITIDVPGFSRRVVAKLRERGFYKPCIHYVAPTVWAYKPERAALFASMYDLQLVLLPFEPPYFEAVGLPCFFVGHPVVDAPRGDGRAFREKHSLAADTPIVGLFPGSRSGEIKRHLRIFAESLLMLSQRLPNLNAMIMVPPHLRAQVEEHFAGCPYAYKIVSDEAEKLDAMGSCDVALVKSGTISLQLARAGVPMVVAYRVSAISAWMLRRVILTKYVSLVNILEGREAVPELLQQRCQSSLLAEALTQIMENQQVRDAQKAAFESALSKLRLPSGKNSSEAAAESIIFWLSKS